MSDPQIIDPDKLIVNAEQIAAIYRGQGTVKVTVIETVAGNKHIITNKEVLEVARLVWPEKFSVG